MGSEAKAAPPAPPAQLFLIGSRSYSGGPTFFVSEEKSEKLDPVKVDAWAKNHAPKLVYIHDYELTGAQIERDQLAARYKQHQWHELTNEEQTIKIILDLAKVDIDEFLSKGGTPEGRTVRSFDKRAASSYLSKQFRDLWTQKKVNFHVEIDGPTLNIFAEDEAVGMPVRLHRRSSGFRWHVSFAWKFTHASLRAVQGVCPPARGTWHSSALFRAARSLRCFRQALGKQYHSLYDASCFDG